MLPTAVRILLVEGENADGVTVDREGFDTSNPPERVVAAILGTWESAAAGGHRLTSTGVTISDEAQVGVLRDALARHQMENVMLVSAFLAAAALTQAFGNATGAAQIALLFVEADTATLAVVNSDDGSIADVHRQVLPDDDALALAALTRLAADAERLWARPDGLLVVGSGVDVRMIKPALQAATALSVSVPEEPEMALARGAAVASAHAPLFVSSTRAEAWSQDPGTRAVGQDVARPDSALIDFRAAVAEPGRERLLVGSLSLFVIGVVALAFSLAAGIRPTVDQRPDPGGHVVIRTEPAAAVPAPLPPAPKPPAPAVQPVPAKPLPEMPPAVPPPPALPPPPVPLPPALPPPPIPGIPGVPGIPGIPGL
jgi:hypothetical protein